MTRHQDRNSPFRLNCIETAPTREGLADLSLMRVQEIDGFIAGLFGREDRIDLPERAHRALDDLAKMRALFVTVQHVATDETKADAARCSDDTSTSAHDEERGARDAHSRSVLHTRTQPNARGIAVEQSRPPLRQAQKVLSEQPAGSVREPKIAAGSTLLFDSGCSRRSE